MSRFIKLEQWRNNNFCEPRPHMNTIRNWANSGFIEGAVKKGRGWYVDTQKLQNETSELLAMMEALHER